MPFAKKKCDTVDGKVGSTIVSDKNVVNMQMLHLVPQKVAVSSPDEKLPLQPLLSRHVVVERDAEVASLRRELDERNKQLRIQTQVNTEVRRLLVASVGEDIEAKVDFLTQVRNHDISLAFESF